MRENGGCVMSHLLQHIKQDVQSQFSRLSPGTLSLRSRQRHELLLSPPS